MTGSFSINSIAPSKFIFLSLIFCVILPNWSLGQNANFLLPREYVWTEGQSTPRFEGENYSVTSLYVHDFNNDGCDDVLVSFADSLSVPRVIMGGRQQRLGDISLPLVRLIRHAVSRDVNGDGISDFVAFTAPHGWKEKELGSAWNSYEPDFIYFSGQGGSYFSLPRETYAHTGIVGDVNGDGIVDIWPIDELNSRLRRPYIFSANPISFRDGRNFRRFSSAVISGAASGDLNGDGIDDFVITLASPINQRVTPREAERVGAFAVALGRPRGSIDELDWITYSREWLSDDEWRAFLSATEGSSSTPYTAPSNIDLIDINGDGHLDIFIGFYVSLGSWRSAGFQVWENQGDGTFIDETEKYAPHQRGLKNMERTVSFIKSAAMVDVNSDGLKDLVITNYDSDAWARQGESISVYLNRNGRFFPMQGNSRMSSYSHFKVGDFNCDGRLDLVGLGPTTQSSISIGFFYK